MSGAATPPKESPTYNLRGPNPETILQVLVLGTLIYLLVRWLS